MHSATLRRLAVGILGTAVAAGVAVTTAPAASAAPAFTPTSTTITGDVTGDGTSDRVTLGYVGDVRAQDCTAQVAAGLGSGTFAAPTLLPLPMRGGKLCPDLGVVVRGPIASQNQLAVTFFEFSPTNPAYLVQLFGFTGGEFVPRGHFQGTYQPSVLGTQDFDGDGWGDLWESTDQGSGFQAFVGRKGVAWRSLYSTPAPGDAQNQFFDLNHQGGTDVLVTWWTVTAGSGAAVVDGRTGAVQVLRSGPDDASVRFTASVIDIDHDRYPDVLVTATGDDGVPTAYRFLNRSQGGRWSFRPVG